ncbi:MAG: hypothetical protein WBW81_02035 [Methylocella sp.]
MSIRQPKSRRLPLFCGDVTSQRIFLLVSLLTGLIVMPQVAWPQDNPAEAAANCSDQVADINTFSTCWVSQMMTDQQRQVANCIAGSNGLGGAAFCMAGMNLSPIGLRLAGCAQQSGGNLGAAAACAGLRYLDPQAQRVAACVARNPTNFWGAALCAGGQNLTPEQQVFANCAVATGMQPYAMAGCVAGQLTTNELQKCVSVGIGGRGCFGENNTIVVLVRDAWRGVAGGPNSVLNRPAQVFGGPNSVFNNPGQLAGGPNSVINNPGQVFGGPNSVVRNPDQILGGDNSFFHKNLGIHF